MSGALNSVLGGANILKSALNAASFIFPQAAIANAMSNMLTNAIGSAIGGAVDSLTKDMGMPKFVANAVKDALAKVIPGMQKESDPAASAAVQDKAGQKFLDFEKELMSDITDAFKRYKSDNEKEGGGGASKNGGAGGAGGGGKSWFVALMQALGEVQNKQAEKLEKLAGEVSDLLGAGDDSGGSQAAQFDKMEEFKAEAKLQEVLANVTKSVGDAIGNSLSTVARAQ
jgi:hypothetical protein